VTIQRKLTLGLIDNPIGRTLIRALFGVATLVDRALSLLYFVAVLTRADRTSWCHWTTQVKCPENIRIGKHVTIGPHCVLGAAQPIDIGDYVRIGRNVTLETGGLAEDQVPPYPHVAKPIRIEEGAILYANSTILGGVTVGKFSIVSANCVVTKDVPPYSVVAVARRQEVLRRPSVRRNLEEGAAAARKIP
jgi:acetyltransferase-like isoleucine patch superfamily enzyme